MARGGMARRMLPRCCVTSSTALSATRPFWGPMTSLTLMSERFCCWLPFLMQPQTMTFMIGLNPAGASTNFGRFSNMPGQHRLADAIVVWLLLAGVAHLDQKACCECFGQHELLVHQMRSLTCSCEVFGGSSLS